MDNDEALKVKKPKIDPVVDFVAGTLAGMAGLVIAFPFDTVKVRFQNPETRSRYRSTFHAFTTIIREERVRGLFKGILSPMVSAAPLNGLIFSSYRFFMHMQVESDDDIPTLTQVGLAGVGSGIVSSFITCPIELIKIRQQNIVEHQPSTRDVAVDIFRRTGVRGLYRGITATALRDVGYGAYFATYEGALRYFTPPPSGKDAEGGTGTLSWPALLTAGALAGISGWLATFMFDVVKTRVQGVEYNGPPPKSLGLPVGTSPLVTNSENPYRTTWSTLINSYRAEGVTFFFRGLTPTLLRAVPVNMATFGVFEGIVRLLS